MRKKSGVRKLIASGMIMVMGMAILTGCDKKTGVEDFANYAMAVDEITLPEQVRIVALGEATHGNKEFQELKLDVFSHLVKTTAVRAFVLEGDFGSCSIANEYIVHDIGTAEDAVKNLGFEIYRTDEMLDLVQWMHDYNQGAEDDDKVRLYGMDMQRYEHTLEHVKEFYNVVDQTKSDAYTSKWYDLYGTGEENVSAENLADLKELVKEMIADFESQQDTYINATNEEKYAYALQSVRCLHQNLELHAAGSDYISYSNMRDKFMAENVKWILEREINLYGTKIMISGHNGHVAKAINSSYTNMGSYLSEEMQEAYFVIGTDFYKTNCSIATEKGREDYRFCSDDPIAKEVGDMEENIYYLDFKEAEESETLSDLLDSDMRTGSLGESYSPLMKLVKSSYQLRIAPNTLYDGMIFVYEATPIEVWDYQEKDN